MARGDELFLTEVGHEGEQGVFHSRGPQRKEGTRDCGWNETHFLLKRVIGVEVGETHSWVVWEVS